MPVKLTWHEGNQVWSKVVGKKLSKDGTRLIQAQWYFTPNREESENLASARKAEWRRLKRGWDGEKVLLDLTSSPFSEIPHWFGRKSEGTPQAKQDREEAIGAARREYQPTQSDLAEAFQEMDIAECAGLFFDNRKLREGIDFSAPTNKSFKTDLDGALRAIDTTIKMVELLPDHLEGQRIRLLKACASTNTARNYGRAMKMMLHWYYNSPYFFGGIVAKGIDEVFARYPKKRPAKPKHLGNDALATILTAASRRRRLYLLLMLNAGMQPTDIPHVTHNAFDFERATVKWFRHKNERVKNPSDHEITSYLWPETLELVREFMCRQPGPAFRTAEGKPMYHESAGRNRQNAVTKSLAKFFKKVRRDHGIGASAKNFRQTGAQMIQEVTDDYSLSQIWLGRKFEIVDRPYLRQVYDRLGKASNEVRKRLISSGVFRAGAGQSE